MIKFQLQYADMDSEGLSCRANVDTPSLRHRDNTVHHRGSDRGERCECLDVEARHRVDDHSLCGKHQAQRMQLLQMLKLKALLTIKFELDYFMGN